MASNAPGVQPVAAAAAPAFSYAQAIKGKSATPNQPVVPTSAPAATPSTNDTPRSISPKPSVSSTDRSASTADDSANGTRSSVATTLASSLATLTSETTAQSSQESKIDTAAQSSPTNSPALELNSMSQAESKPRSPIHTEGTKSAHEDVVKDDYARASEEESPKTLKEAPPPVVNIWQLRAQTQPKAAPASNGAKAEDKPASPSSTVPSKDAQTQTQRNNKPASAALTPPADSKAQKPSRQKPPSVQDTVSWPTPETVQIKDEEQRKKTHDKTDKTENAPASRAHGKNEWVAMPFTPSVKFNTPMPDSRGRGGRTGGRSSRGSGRGGFSAGRGGASSATSNSADVSGESTPRGRSDSAQDRSASVPPKADRTASGSQTTARDVSESTNRGRQASAQGDSTFLKPTIPASSTALQASSNADVQSSVTTHATLPDSSQVDVTPADKKSFSAQAGAPASRPRRKSSQTPAGQSTVSTTNGDQATGNGPDASKSGKQLYTSSSSRKGDTTTRSHDGSRDPSAASQARERSEGRQRGNKARNSFYGPSHINTGQSFTNGYPPAGSQSSKSSTFPSFPYSQGSSNGRGFRPSPRSASIPSESTFGRFPGNFQDVGMYDQFGFPPMYGYSPAFAGYADANMVNANLVANQIGYYFSKENLIKDVFLRRHMDSKGFVPLSLIAGFKRIKDLTSDAAIIKNICQNSPILEIRVGRDGQERVRTTEDPSRWVMPLEERDPSAQNDGPEDADQHVNGPSGQYSHDAMRSAMQLGGFAPTGDFFAAQYGGFAAPYPPMPMTSAVNGGYSGTRPGPQNRFSMSAIDSRTQVGPPSPIPQQNGNHNAVGEEQDTFSDERLSDLMVYSRPKGSSHSRSGSQATAQAQTNGSSEHASENEPSNGQEERRSRSPNDKESGDWDQTRKIAELKKSLTTSRSRSKPSRDFGDPSFYLKDSPDDNGPGPLPQDSTAEPYEHLRARALHKRDAAPEGQCPDELYMLYDFWSHFLIRNFNTSVYNDFRKLAHEDAYIKSSTMGMDLLINFYTHSLKGRHNMYSLVASHFVELVQNEDPGKDRPAFKHLRGAWRDGATNLRNRKLISQYIDEQLKSELDR